LLGSERGLPLCLLGGLTGNFGRLALPRSKGLSLALGLECETGPLVAPNLSRLDDSSPCSLPCENNWVIRCGTCPEPGYRGLARLRGGLKTVNELVGFELAHVHSLCAPRLSAGGEKQKKPLQVERLRNPSWADEQGSSCLKTAG